MKPTKEMLNSIPFQYANDVLSGKVVAGKYVILAVKRFFKWIEDSEADGYTLNHSYGMDIIEFFETYLIHTKGKTAGKPFILSPFQQFTLYNVFGWVDSVTDLRRINEVYESMAKKNGKTAVMAGVGLYHMAADHESEAEVYIGATKEDQAKLCFNQAVSFIKRNSMLNQNGFTVRQNRLLFDPLGGMMRPLGGDSKTQDGINSSLAIIDEYHAHPDDSVKENLESSSVARSQPIIWHISTKGVDLFGPCKLYEDVCKDMLDGVIPDDDRRFMMIHEMDATDDWENEDNWQKANPNLGVSVQIDNIREAYKKAKSQSSKIPNFKTKSLNIWVDAPEVRIPDEDYMKNNGKIRIGNFLKYGCAGGLDLSSTIDLSAMVYVSNPDPEGFRDVLPLIFCPKDTINQRSKEDRVPYSHWQNVDLADYCHFENDEEREFYDVIINTKILTATEGNQIDYAVIEKVFLQTYWLFEAKWFDYDKWKSTELVQRLTAEGILFVPFPQTVTYYSHPTKEFERLLFMAKWRHGGHPILRWMMARVKAYVNNNEDIRYVKSNPKGRIDGIIGWIMGFSATISEVETNESKYNDPDTDISFGIGSDE